MGASRRPLSWEDGHRRAPRGSGQLLTKAGYAVHVVMTAEAQRFVTAVLFKTLRAIR
jgi:hypothetical protein